MHVDRQVLSCKREISTSGRLAQYNEWTRAEQSHDRSPWQNCVVKNATWKRWCVQWPQPWRCLFCTRLSQTHGTTHTHRDTHRDIDTHRQTHTETEIDGIDCYGARTFCSVPRCGRSLLTVDTVPWKKDKKSPAINRVVRCSVLEYAREYGSRT